MRRVAGNAGHASRRGNAWEQPNGFAMSTTPPRETWCLRRAFTSQRLTSSTPTLGTRRGTVCGWRCGGVCWGLARRSDWPELWPIGGQLFDRVATFARLVGVFAVLAWVARQHRVTGCRQHQRFSWRSQLAAQNVNKQATAHSKAASPAALCDACIPAMYQASPDKTLMMKYPVICAPGSEAAGLDSGSAVLQGGCLFARYSPEVMRLRLIALRVSVSFHAAPQRFFRTIRTWCQSPGHPDNHQSNRSINLFRSVLMGGTIAENDVHMRSETHR